VKVRFAGEFERQFAVLDIRIKGKFLAAKDVWMKDPFARPLNNHTLAGKYKGYRSINITGDFRAIYRLEKPDIGVFVAIGKHSQLYR
jgi:addiction module RelE/StbE family toxin